MSVGGVNKRPSTQQTSAPVQAKKTEAPKQAEGAFAGAKASGTATASKSFFSGIKENIFNAIKNAGPGIKDLGQKLINDPGVKSALGAGDPSKVIDAARDFAKGKINEKLANAEFKLPSGEKSWSAGKNLPEGVDSKAFVDKGFAGGELGIKPTKTGSKEVTLTDGQKAGVDKAAAGLGKIQDGFAKAGELAKLAEKLGIPVPKFEKSGEVGTSKTLASSADGNHKITADASAKGKVSAGVDGLKAEGEAKVGVTATSQGSVSGSNKYGDANASYNATATAGASAKGSATLDASGLKATGEVQVGVKAEVTGQANVESKPIGGVPGLTVGAGVKGTVTAEATAYAKGEASVSAGPPAVAIVEGKAGAFAGVRATAEGTVKAGPVGATGKAEVWAGIGAEVSGTAGYKDGKLSLGFSAGAGYGVGAKLGFNVELDVGKAKQIAEHVVDKVADGAKKVADADGDGKLSLNDAKVGAQKVATAVSSGAQAVGNAVSSGAKAVGNAVSTGVSNAASTVKNFASKLKFW
jgi:hypothetical protein